jgi:hypothetical protein
MKKIALVSIAFLAAAADKNFTVNIDWNEFTDQPYMEGFISVGTPRLNLTAMFLMNFEETLVMSKECTNCIAEKYNISNSTSG